MPGYQGQGLGRVMVQTVAKDLLRRGFRAIEAFGDAHWEGPACLLPADHLLAVGFKTVRPHPVHPRLRLELRSTLSWKEDVELALDRLLGAARKEAGAAAAVSTKRGTGPPPMQGAAPFHVKHRSGQAVLTSTKSARSRRMAAFGFAPTMVLATSPPW